MLVLLENHFLLYNHIKFGTGGIRELGFRWCYKMLF